MVKIEEKGHHWNSPKSMEHIFGARCRKCKGHLYKTYLTGKIFCRHCWEYKTKNGGTLK